MSTLIRLNIILAIQKPNLFLDWNFASIISDIQVHLLSLYSWKVYKVFRSANFRAYCLARWIAFNLVFGSIPDWSPILSFIRIRSWYDPPLQLFPHLLKIIKLVKHFQLKSANFVLVCVEFTSHIKICQL
jgi:hypothetical protein